MSRVIHFEIHAEDVERARQFYEIAFGWQMAGFDAVPDYYFIKTGEDDKPGINGVLMKRRGGTVGTIINSFICTIDIADMEECITKVTMLGGTVVVPKLAVPAIGWLAYCKDTEGNIFGISQADPTVRLS